MLRCQTCGSRNAVWEWCSRCGDPNPFARFKKLRAIGVFLALAIAVVLALIAHQRMRSLDLSVQAVRMDAGESIYFARRAGI